MISYSLYPKIILITFKHVERTPLIVLILKQVQSVRASVGAGLLPSAHDGDKG